eukprot:6850656-Prymnesium_polylepis.1
MSRVVVPVAPRTARRRRCVGTGRGQRRAHPHDSLGADARCLNFETTITHLAVNQRFTSKSTGGLVTKDRYHRSQDTCAPRTTRSTSSLYSPPHVAFQRDAEYSTES